MVGSLHLVMAVVPTLQPPAEAAVSGSGGEFVPLQGRLVDTRSTGGQLLAGQWRPLKVAGVLGMPSTGVGSVQITLTALNASTAGTLVVGPDGGTASWTALVYGNGVPGTVSNTAIVAVAQNGYIAVKASVSVDVIVDVQGYYTAGTTTAGGYVPLPPKRLLDTRNGPQLLANSTKTISVGGSAVNAGVPTDAAAVFVNFTVYNTSTANGSLTPYATGATVPATALAFPMGETTTLGAVVPLSAAGQMDVKVNGVPIHLVVDVIGYFAPGPAGGAFTPASARLINNVTIPAHGTITAQVTGVDAVPQNGLGVNAVALNLQAVHAGTATGYMAMGASDAPWVPVLTLADNATRSNFATVAVGADGKIQILNSSADSVRIYLDLQGWYDVDLPPSVSGVSLDPCVDTCSSLVAASANPDLTAVVADPDSQTIDARFEVREPGATDLVASGSDLVESGQTARFAIPGGALRDGATYEFRVAAVDATSTIWSSWTSFTVRVDPEDPATALRLAEPLVIYDTGAELKWTAYRDPSGSSADDLVEYQVYRGCVTLPDGSCTQPVIEDFSGSASGSGPQAGLVLAGTVAKDQRTWTDESATASSATADASYRYWVAARTQDDVDHHRPAQVATNSWLVTTPRTGRVRRILAGLGPSSQPPDQSDGIADTTISQAQPDGVFGEPKNGSGTSGPWIQVGTGHPDYGVERALLWFDTGAIEAGLTVTAAHLELQQVGGGGSASAIYELRTLSTSFDEREATWRHANTTTTWADGGDLNPGAVATFTTDATAKRHSIDGSGQVRATVQGWVNQPNTNHGFALKALTEGATTSWLNLAAAEATDPATRPRLVVESLRTTPAQTFQAPTIGQRFLPNTVTTVPVTITNTSNQEWPSTLQLAYRWAEVGGTADTSTFTSDRYVALNEALSPGESVTVSMRLRAPINSATGEKLKSYDLFLDLWTGTSWWSATHPYSTATLTGDQREQLQCTVVASNPVGGLLCPSRVVDASGSTELGLEEFYSYTGLSTGGGGQLLTNLHTGNLVWSYDAYTNPSVGPGMFARLTYSSRDNGSTGTVGDSGTGPGWSVQPGTLNRLGTLLSPTSNDKEVTLVDGDGTQHTWLKDDTATSGTATGYLRPAGVALTLQKDTSRPDDQRWRFTRPDGTRFFFATSGRATSVVDRNDNKLLFGYDAAGHLTTVTAHSNRPGVADTTVGRLSWSNNRLASVTDVSGRGLQLTYNSAGQLITLRDGGGFNRDANSGLGSFTDLAAVRTFTFTYTTATTNALLQTVTDPRSHQTQVAYYSSTDTYPSPDNTEPMPSSITGWPKTVTDRAGRVTTLRYFDDDSSDGTNIRAKVIATDPDGPDPTTVYRVDGFGRTFSLKDANANAEGRSDVTELVWDADHRVTQLTQPTQPGQPSAVSRWQFDPDTGYPVHIWDAEAVRNHSDPQTLTYAPLTGIADAVALTAVTSPLGKRTEFSYDARGNLKTVTDPLGKVTKYDYDVDGTQIRAEDANGHATTFDYSLEVGAPLGYPTTITPPGADAPSQYAYDSRGNVTQTTQTSGTTTLTTTAVYDAFGRATAITRPGAQSGARTTRYTYDLNDNLLTSTAPNNAVTTTSYTVDDLAEAQTLPPNASNSTPRQTRYKHDALGRVTEVTSPQGTLTAADPDDHVIRYSYDLLGRVLTLTQPLAGPDRQAAATTFVYDLLGNTTSVTDPRGNTSRTVYDLNGRPTTGIDPAGYATHTRFDADGNVIATIDQRGNVTNYDYDDAGRLTAKTITHTPTGQTLQKWVQEFAYDAVGNLTKQYQPHRANTSADLFTETVYDQNNRPTQQNGAYKDGDPNYGRPAITYYQYDPLGRLTKQSAPTRSTAGGQDWTQIDYYDSGEIKTSTDPWGITTSYKYNRLGQQTQRTLTGDTSDSARHRTMTWTYFPDGSLASHNDSASPALEVTSDNTGAAVTGTWTARSDALNKVGADYLIHAAAPTNDPQADSISWTLTPAATGRYRIEANCLPAPEGQPAATTSALYTISGSVTGTANLDQSTCQDDGIWRALGTYTLSTTTPITIKLGTSPSGAVTADAVRLVRLDNDRAFTYAYDADGQQVLVTDNTEEALTAQYASTYDALGRVSQVQELRANGSARRTTTYTYDIASNLKTLTANRGAAPEPDAAGNLTASTFAAYCWDNRNQISTITTGTSPSQDLRRWKYTYDPAGMVATLTKPASTDSLNQTQATSCATSDDPSGNKTTYAYHESGLLRSMVERNPRVTSGSDLVASHQLWYYPTGDRSRDVSRLDNADTTGYLDQTTDYTYTPSRQLARVTKSGTDKSGNETYQYDAGNNITQQTIAAKTTIFTYDRNRLTSATSSGLATTYHYDAFGRLTSATADSVTTTYGYDGFDRQTSQNSTGPSGPILTKTTVYDALDRTAMQTVTKGSGPSVKTRFNYLGLTENVAIEEQPDPTGAWKPSKTYNYGPDGKPLVFTDTPVQHQTGSTVPGPSTQLYGYNPHGDTETLTNPATGAATATYRYTAYGNPDSKGTTGRDKTSDSDPNPTDVLNPIRFNAKRIDPATGNYDMGFRNYDPGLNRFLTRDSYNGALDDLALGTDPWNTNRYAFTGGNPATMIELDGHDLCASDTQTCNYSYGGGGDAPVDSGKSFKETDHIASDGPPSYPPIVGGQMAQRARLGGDSVDVVTEYFMSHSPSGDPYNDAVLSQVTAAYCYDHLGDALRCGPDNTPAQNRKALADFVIMDTVRACEHLQWRCAMELALTIVKPGKVAKTVWAAETAGAGDHIVLGLRAHGLEETATKVGGRTLLKDPDWMASLQKGIADPSTKFTVSLDGMSGSSTYQQVMGAATRGASGAGGYTDWEMAQLFQGGRLPDVTFVRGGVPVENPWVP